MTTFFWVCLLIAASFLMSLPRTGIAADTTGKSSSLMLLDADSSQLNGDMIALHTRLQDIHKTLWLTKTLLAVPGYLASDLKKLESELKLLDGLLTTAQAIPELREDAQNAKQQIEIVLKEFSAARAKAEQVEQQVKPFKTTIDTADSQIQKVDTNAERFRVAIVNPMSTYTNIAQTCVNNAVPAGRPCMQRAVDSKGNNLDVGVKQLDKVVKLALTDMPDLISLKKLDADFEALDSIRKKVASVLKEIHPMIDALKELDSLLKQHFHEKFPYPDPTWKDPIRISHYEIKVSMRTILNGSKAIEDEIEHALSKSMWEAAKVFGVGKLVNSLKHQAEKDLSTIKSKLHLKNNLRIPELAQLDSIFSNITTDIAKFPANFGVNLPDISLDAPSLNFRGELIDLSALKRLMSELAPHGISGPSANLCAGVSYGCTTPAAQQTHGASPTPAPATPSHVTPNHVTPSQKPPHFSAPWPVKH